MTSLEINLGWDFEDFSFQNPRKFQTIKDTTPIFFAAYRGRNRQNPTLFTTLKTGM